MSTLKVLGILVAVVSWCIHIASYNGDQLQSALRAAIFAPLSIWLIVRFLAANSMVNPLAGWWGPHSVWKIILAALLLLVIPIGAYLLSRAIGRSWQNGAPNPDRMVNPHRPTWLQVFLPFMLLYAILAIMLILSFIDWPTYPTDTQMRWAIEEHGYYWIEIHPTPAIHHTYATASLLGIGLIYLSGLAITRPLASRLASLIGSAEKVKLISFLTNTGGSILAWFS